MKAVEACDVAVARVAIHRANWPAFFDRMASSSATCTALVPAFLPGGDIELVPIEGGIGIVELWETWGADVPEAIVGLVFDVEAMLCDKHALAQLGERIDV